MAALKTSKLSHHLFALKTGWGQGKRQGQMIAPLLPWPLARIIHDPSAAIAYLTPSPGLILIADLEVLQYACARLTAISPGSDASYTISLQRS